MESAFFPLQIERHSESMGKTATVIAGYFPVEESHPAAVDVLVPKFDFVKRNPFFEQVKKNGGTVFSAAELNQVFIV